MYIESQQSLFRAQTYYWPKEIWNVAAQHWQPYTGKVPKLEGWGDILSDAQAEALKKP